VETPDMNLQMRALKEEDLEQVKNVSFSVWEDDYVPDNYITWICDPFWIPFGIFDESSLLGFTSLQLIPDANHAWVKALRIHVDHQNEGLGSKLTEFLIERAQEHGVRRLWYATSSRNTASQRIAEKNDFTLINEVGYFRLARPFPPHQTPSPNIELLDTNIERIIEYLTVYPDLMPTDTVPIAWNFETKDHDGLKRIEQKAKFKIVLIDGIPVALRYAFFRERGDVKSVICSIYATDRSVFVDLVARSLEEYENSEVDRIVFFLGPNATEWSQTLGIIPEEYNDRKFILYEKLLSD
jgi:RimJ/RimL family protein N-acetyltransferase